MKKNIAKLALSSAALALTGCATIIGDPNQVIPIASMPSDASISIIDEKGAEIFKGMTPTTVTLPKGSGSYFGRKNYTVKLAKDGFETQSVSLTASINGWYIFGNAVFGGLIGWLIVDPFNGHMYTLSPDQVNASMAAAKVGQTKANPNGISVVLIQNVPQDLRDKMIQVQ